LLLPGLLTEEVVTRILESLFDLTLRQPNIIILFGRNLRALRLPLVVNSSESLLLTTLFVRVLFLLFSNRSRRVFGRNLGLRFCLPLSWELLTESCFVRLTDYEVLTMQRRQLTRLELSSLRLLTIECLRCHTRLLLIIRVRLWGSNDGRHHTARLILTNDWLLILDVMLYSRPSNCHLRKQNWSVLNWLLLNKQRLVGPHRSLCSRLLLVAIIHSRQIGKLSMPLMGHSLNY
jgi:hypothetical protein